MLAATKFESAVERVVLPRVRFDQRAYATLGQPFFGMVVFDEYD